MILLSLKEVASFSIQGKFFVLKVEYVIFKKMIAIGSMRKKSHGMLFTVSFDFDLDPF